MFNNARGIPFGSFVKADAGTKDDHPPVAFTRGGVATIDFAAKDRSGKATLKAHSGKATSNSIQIAVAIVVNQVMLNATPLHLSCTGGSVALSAYVTDLQHAPIAGQVVLFSADEGTLQATTVITNDTGVAANQLTTLKTTTVTAFAQTHSEEQTIAVDRDCTP